MNEILVLEKQSEYELLDSGNGHKLEKFGDVILSRPDPQAIWQKKFPEKWLLSDFVFQRDGQKGKWIDKTKSKKNISDGWKINLFDLVFNLDLLPSKHTGLFPEQMENWRWLEGVIKKNIKDRGKISVLNLFGYTGGATLACARARADVCHVDASKFAVDIAMKNRDDSGLSSKPIRFIQDDVKKFVEREIKRGNKYDIIILDPPIYGKGVKNEVWNLDEDLLPFLIRLKEVLSKNPLAVLLNGYSSVYSPTSYLQILDTMVSGLGGKNTAGELVIKESSGRFLPSGIFAKWEK